MRIKSNFKDYYDIGMGLGHDPYPFYLRKETVIRPTNENPYPFSMHTNPGGFQYPDEHFQCIPKVIGFCGKVYDFVEIILTGNRRHICYTMDEVDNLIRKHFNAECWECYSGNRSGMYWRRAKTDWKYRPRRSDIERHVGGPYEISKIAAYKGHWLKKFGQGRDPIFLAQAKDPRLDNLPSIRINAQLKGQQFFRIFDAYRAYQELSMWLGNLAEERKVIPKLDDETMAEIKGFDKFSFRKDRSSKPRRAR